MNGDPSGALRGRGVVAAVLLALLGLAACRGENEPTRSQSDGEARDLEQAGQAGTLTGVSPLTGAQVGAQAPEHPVLVVKIDNTDGSAPQVGLGGADLVVEELVEGGLTRLAAFYWEQTPVAVGPVRSVRGTDIGIVAPADAALVASGGTPRTVRQVQRAGIATFFEATDGFSRDRARIAPYNLMIDLESLAGTFDASAPPASYLPFGDAGELPAGAAAARVEVAFSTAQTTSWRYHDGTGYVRSDSLAEQGDDFVPVNLLVIDVEVGDAGYRDAAGSLVPESEFFGKGDAVLFHGGRAIRATWSKERHDDPLQLRTRDGEPLGVPVGKTWIELMPRVDAAVTYSG
ncbi:MAG: DUF3048 domain-containing protein [Actinomycetota bacterium]|nr:DUF3048 domain-containing protein [Actinomycetota bacterium]